MSMSHTDATTRRSFIRTAGAAISAPLALAAPAAANAAPPVDPLAARLSRLEDSEAIRSLWQGLIRHLNADAHAALAALFDGDIDVRAGVGDGPSLTAIQTIGEDVIEISPDRQTAVARVPCTVVIETPIGPSCPLVEMAREQGGGVLARTEAGTFEHACVRRDGVWKIRRATYHPTP
jgi:hypothetical protein